MVRPAQHQFRGRLPRRRVLACAAKKLQGVGNQPNAAQYNGHSGCDGEVSRAWNPKRGRVRKGRSDEDEGYINQRRRESNVGAALAGFCWAHSRVLSPPAIVLRNGLCVRPTLAAGKTIWQSILRLTTP